MRKIQQLPGIGRVRFEPEHFRIHYHGPAGAGIANLENAFVDAQKSPAEVSLVIDEYLKSAAQVVRADELFKDVRSRLMPIVRDAAYFSITDLNSQIDFPDKPGSAIAVSGVAPDVTAAIAVDAEGAVATVSKDRLRSWGASFDDAMSIAVENLGDKTIANFKETSAGLFESQWHDGYDASRIFLPDMLHRLPLRGTPVVGIPSRNHLLVAGSQDGTALAALVDRVAAIIEEDTRPMCPFLLKFDKGLWTVFSDEVPGSIRLTKAWYGLKSRDYEQQKKLLDRLHKGIGADIFVASFLMHEDSATRSWSSQTALTRGVNTILPRADRLAFVDPGTQQFMLVDWGKAESVLGEHLKPLRLMPERYQISRFPADSELAELRNSALQTGYLKNP
jgi:hypothetical protein